MGAMFGLHFGHFKFTFVQKTLFGCKFDFP